VYATVRYRRPILVPRSVLWLLPLWWILVATAWLCVWCCVWIYEAYVGSAVRATRTTCRVFGRRR
jgi:hypothetical protein